MIKNRILMTIPYHIINKNKYKQGQVLTA